MIDWLDPYDPLSPFPSLANALNDPNGLLAAGGDLTSERLLNAYRQGIFPWYEAGQPILWWSPDPRAVLYPTHLHISRSLRKTLRNRPWTIRFDTAFRQVILACAEPRERGVGTWITAEMQNAYCNLHAQGHAHSIEVWSENGELLGGLYGIAIGRVFFGESMFSRVTDSSKVAMVGLCRHLVEWDYQLIDCQVHSDHICSLGAELISRRRFVSTLDRYCQFQGNSGSWQADPELDLGSWIPSSE